MKLFGWMQNKLNGNKQVINNKSTNPVVSSSHHVKQDSREEFSDWPHSLLAIGTFGNTEIRSSSSSSSLENQELKNIQQQHHQEQELEIQEPSSSPEDDLQGFTEEEIGKLQKEVTKLLSKKPSSDIHNDNYKNLPLDRFLNCPSSLEVDRRISNYTVKSDIDENINSEDDIERTISVILGRCKDIREKKSKKKTIGKKSISFLIKKMFVSSSGFAPQPSLRDTLQESRMEKLLRMMLQRKMNPQNTSRASSMKKYLEDNKSVSYRKEKEEEKEKEKEKEKICDGSKWVKTDSEYIVLEI